MTTPKDDEQRWFAHFLGDEEDASAETKSEAEAARRTVEELRAWATAPVPYLSVDPAFVAHPGRPARLRTAWPWAMAAALIVIALGQVNFSFQVGDAVIAWGGTAPVPSRDAATGLADRLADLERAQAETLELLDAMAVKTMIIERELRNAAIALAHNQRVEAQTRLRDMEQLVRYSAAGGVFLPVGYNE